MAKNSAEIIVFEKSIKNDDKTCCTTTIENIESMTAGEELTATAHKENDYQTSWNLKMIIMISLLLMPVGVHWMESTLAALKTTLKAKMSIDNTQFSILMSSVTLVNTILPLFAGIFVDDITSIGSIRGTLAVTIVIFIGSLMVTLGAYSNSYPIMLAGQVIYGVGDSIIVTFQEAILSRWFRDKQLSIIVGLMICVTRLTKFLAKIVCYPLVNYAGGDFTRPIIVAMIWCGLSVMANIVYWVAMTKAGFATATGKEIVKPKSGYNIEALKSGRRGRSRKLKFKYSTLLHLPSIFWMVPWLQIIMSGVLNSFANISTEYVQFRFSTSTVMAGYQSSLTQVVPIVAAPLLGLLVHYYGKRIYILHAGIVILIVALVLLSYTWVVPAVGMILVSLSTALSLVALISSMPSLLPSELTGIAMGFHNCSNNIGTTIISILVGFIQDSSKKHDNNNNAAAPAAASSAAYDLLNDKKKYEYEQVMIFYLAVCGVGLLLAFLFWYMDKKQLDDWLQVDRKEREKRLKHAEEECLNRKPTEDYYSYDQETVVNNEKEEKTALKLIGSQLRQKRSFVYVAIFLFWLVVAWIIFFTFALMPIYQHN